MSETLQADSLISMLEGQRRSRLPRCAVRQSAGPTGGATHFYSPKFMPKEGHPTGGRDVGGGLESVPGVLENSQPVRSYRPGWTTSFTEVHVPGVAAGYLQVFSRARQWPGSLSSSARRRTSMACCDAGRASGNAIRRRPERPGHRRGHRRCLPGARGTRMHRCRLPRIGRRDRRLRTDGLS